MQLQFGIEIECSINDKLIKPSEIGSYHAGNKISDFFETQYNF